MEELDEWEKVAEDTYRLDVNGGWLYRYQNGALCFVPDLDSSDRTAMINAIEDIRDSMRGGWSR